ncbi:MAG: type II toxin-antitoxin system ParD family antitoxin [Xanthomonadales bacterium]|jgi:antitoxin ParD1/3/4|nr:type II toxin-antitoxin system ParD family antitoxin [Xanthomonadales bacterium]
MAMVKRSISVTEQQARWIKSKIDSGQYGNESEVFRDLIRERVAQEQEIERVRAALIAAEKSGFTDRSVEDIWEEAEQLYRKKGAKISGQS